jgi:DNA-binding MarR family transcriptional regulator
MYLVCSQPAAHQEYYARKLGRDRSSLTRMIQQLEKSGMLTRIPSDHDRRSLQVAPSTKGVEWALKANKVADEAMRQLWEGIAAEERETLNSLLMRLRGNS